MGGRVYPYVWQKRNNTTYPTPKHRGPHSFERSPLLLYSKLEISMKAEAPETKKKKHPR